MARRATLDRGTPWSADAESLPPDPPPARTSRPRRGSGGRWLVWVLRGVAWVVLLLIGYRGVTAIISNRTATPAAPRAASHGSAFPTMLAQAYALQFGNVYLNFSPATAAQRSRQLAAFLPPGADSQLGWNGAGTEVMQSEQVASVHVQSRHSAVVTLLAMVSNRMIELGVPVYASGNGMVVSGEPALLSAPGRAMPPAATAGNTDQAVVTALLGQLPAFFQAYANGDQVTLDRFLAPGAKVTGLGGAVTLGTIRSVSAPVGGPTRNITVVVAWKVGSATAARHPSGVASSPASLEMTYRMTVVRQGTSWYVQSIGPSPQSPGPP